jgi:glycosyltransferase involved in cell wall biosynthesis
MKMLFVATTSTTAWAFVLPIAKYEREKGHQVEFACSFEDFTDAPRRINELQAAGFKVHEIPFVREINLQKDVKAFWRLRKLILDNQYDLVHTHTSKAGFVGRLSAFAAKCPTIIHTSHSFAFQMYDSGLKRQFFIFLEQIIAPLCDVILCVSEKIYQEAINYNLKSKDKLICVGQGINITPFKAFQSDPNTIRAKYNIQPNDLLVGTIGRLVYQKGMDTFIKAAALVLQKRPDVKFIIAGDGELRSQLQELANSLKITENLQFVGFITDVDAVKNLIASFDIFVLSTRFEGLGVVYLEAMALERPVIGSRIAPVTKVIKEGTTGFLAEVDNPEDFATNILNLLEDSELRSKMGAAGPAHVEREFNLQTVIESHSKIYQEFANCKG